MNKKYLKIENLSDKAILALDGQHGLVKLGLGDQIYFHKASPLCIALSDL